MTIARQAFVTICDDVRIEISGKLIMIGVYTNHIIIPTEPFIAPQLVFNFYAESDINDPFTSVTFEVNLPQQPIQRVDIPLGMPAKPVNPQWTRWFVRQPMIVRPAILHFGRIDTKVIHDRGELEAGGAWILSTPPPPPAPVPAA
jgi:hypothetical protein